MSFINYIVGLVAFYYAYQYAFNKRMVIPDPWVKGQKYVCNQNLSFLIYCVLTAMLFLGPLSLVKYVVWIVIMLMMCFKPGFRKPWNGVMGAYSLFVLWNLYTMTYSQYPSQGWNMIIKFCLPYLYFWLGYNAITCNDDIYAFLKRTCWICCVYALIIGGFSAKFLSPLYAFLNFKTGGLFISYASLADFFAIIFPVSFIMYFETKDKKYLLIAFWLILSTILEGVRTGIGASVLSLSFFYMIVKKGRAIPMIALIIVSFIISVFAIPSVREKMFGDDATSVSVGIASMENISLNGREYMWEKIMDQWYSGHETFGSGCGTALGWLKDVNKDGGLLLIHSDWVQILSESGQVGLGLLILFAVVMIFKVLTISVSLKKYKCATYAGGLTVGAFAACFFAMGFDNVIMYAQQGFVIPFVLLGIFYKSVDLKL